MKIIIGSESFSPNISGVAVVAEILAKHLSDAGHDVYVFAPSQSYKSHYDRQFTSFKVYRLQSIANPFRKGFRVAFMAQKEIVREFNRIKPDIVHLHDPTSICSILLKTARKNHVPIVVHNHFSLDYVTSYLKWAKPFHPLIRKILTFYLARFYNRCNIVICPTETVRKNLLDYGVKTPVVAISNGVDLDRFFAWTNPTPLLLKYHIPANPIVLYVGRIDKDKCIDVLINAIPKILDKINAHFVMTGPGDETEKMQELARKLGVAHAISWTGRIEQTSAEFTQIYQSATVFAHPSPIETQSIVTLEAMASGLPIVAANAGALPELVKNGKNGYLFTPGDAHDFAEKIAKILLNKQLQATMSKQSLDIVSSHQINKSFKQIKDIYEKLTRLSQR